MRLDDWVLCRVKKKGSLLPEKYEKPTLATWVFSKVQGLRKQVVVKERSNLLDLSDWQFMSYLLGLAASKAESGSECSEFLPGDEYIGVQQEPEMVPTMLSSMKRKFSFGALEELMMLHPEKKSSFQFSEGEQLSPT